MGAMRTPNTRRVSASATMSISIFEIRGSTANR
jgi:hypothetical protein